MSKDLIKTVVIRTIPIMTGYICLGIGFGIMLEAAGYGVPWAILMCLTIYSGTMQYVGVGLLASQASLITAAIMSFLINARYMFYGISMIDKFKGAGWRKPYLIFGLTDESYALMCSTEPPEGVNEYLYYFLVTIFNQSYWLTGCTLGVIIGSTMSFDSKGVDFVMTALFVTVFVDQWRETKNHLSAIIGLVATAGCLFIFGPDNFLIPAMICIIVAMSFGRRKIDE